MFFLTTQALNKNKPFLSLGLYRKAHHQHKPAIMKTLVFPKSGIKEA